ncbi:MAG: hypothetical protein HQM15_10040 [Deltaproteobacteria bacterium]|nr:hypothetical protein [Deltaproteobacteria bacterium]
MHSKMKRRLACLASGIFLALTLVACGGSSTGGDVGAQDTPPADTPPADTPPAAAAPTSLNDTIPTDVQITSPFVKVAAGASISRGLVRALAGGVQLATSGSGDDYATHRQAVVDLETCTTVDCCMSNEKGPGKTEPSVLCYGPSITFTNYPGVGDGSAPGGDTGIWDASESSGEACLAAKMNSKIKGVQGMYDFALQRMAQMLCVARVDAIALPTVGETVDLTPNLTSAFAEHSAAMTLSQVTIERVDASTVVFDMKATMVSGSAGGGGGGGSSGGNNQQQQQGGGGSNQQQQQQQQGGGGGGAGPGGGSPSESSSTFNISMNITQQVTGTDTYRGSFRLILGGGGSAFRGGNCPSAVTSTNVMSIGYEKLASEIRIKQVKTVECGELTADEIVTGYLDRDGYPDLSKKVVNSLDAVTTPGWSDDYNEMIANLDSTTGLGSVVYGWMAGHGDNYFRMMNGSSTNTTGSGYFGFQHENTIATQGFGKIQGMVCDWAGPGGLAGGSSTVDYVQYQAMTYNATTNQYENDAANSRLSYAPTLSCENHTTSMTCNGVACPTDNGLLDLAGMSFTLPTDPASIE